MLLTLVVRCVVCQVLPHALLGVGLSLLDYGVGGPRASGGRAVGLRELVVVVVVVITVAQWVVVVSCCRCFLQWRCIVGVLWCCFAGIVF